MVALRIVHYLLKLEIWEQAPLYCMSTIVPQCVSALVGGLYAQVLGEVGGYSPSSDICGRPPGGSDTSPTWQ